MGNWPVATWCFCLALPLIISVVELCKFRYQLAVSGTTSSTPTPSKMPSSASQPASSPPSPASSSCLVSLIRTGLSLLLLFLSRISAVYHRCGLDVGPLCVHGDFQLHSHCARPAEGAGDLRGLYHLRLPQQHLPVPAPAGPGVAVTPSASSQQPWPRCRSWMTRRTSTHPSPPSRLW